jgi:hypothetical protein
MDFAKKHTDDTGKEAAAQSRAGVITYLTYAIDDVSALSPMAAHLLEMAITVLTDDTVGEEEELVIRRPS